MPNRHIKVINGRKYYYESIRIGKKVTSKYLGPVDRIRKKKAGSPEIQEPQIQEKQIIEGEDLPDQESYIG